jgi:transposase, IS5 family
VILLQLWHGLSDAQAEEDLHDRASYRQFVGIGENDDIPDETTIVRFRKKLQILNEEGETYADAFFEEVKRQLNQNNMEVTPGRKIVDATIIECSKGKSKKEEKGKKTSSRDKDAGFTKKNGRTYHGYKGHVSTDTKGKFIQKAHISTATDHDSQHQDEVLDGDEHVLFGDSAYNNDADKREFRQKGKFYGMVDKARRNRPLSPSQKKRNRQLSSARCRVEHPFAEMKNPHKMKFRVRYRGDLKNSWHWTMACASYNLKRMVGILHPPQKQAVSWIL